MAKANMNVDFIDDEDLDKEDALDTESDEYKNQRAKVAHQLAVLIMADREAKHGKKQPAKKKSVIRGALTEE